MEIVRVVLPSVGVSYAFVTGDGSRLGVICHPSGARDIVLYDHDDASAAHATTSLSLLEAHHLADLLRTTTIIDLVPDGQQAPSDDAGAITVARVPIPAGSDHDGRRLASLDTAEAPVVAVVRDDNPVVDPGGRWVLRYGDTLIAVGTRRAIDRLGRVVAGDVSESPTASTRGRAMTSNVGR